MSALLILGATLSSIQHASAEGLEIGGYVVLESYDQRDNFGDYFENEVNLVGTLGYRSGDWYVGIGQQYQAFFYDDGDIDDDRYDHFVMVGYGAYLLSYGEIQGAGNLFNEEYFGMSDATGQSDETIRVDYGSDSGPVRHVALSYDIDDDDTEIGLSLDFSETLVGLGLELDSSGYDLGLIVSQPIGDYTVHGVYHYNEYGGDSDLGFTAFREFGPVEVGLHIEFEPGESGHDLVEALGVVAYYDTPIGLLNAQFRREYDGDYTVFETGIVIPIGTPAPYYAERSTEREQVRRFGY